VEYQDIIEERWTANFGDRLNEIVFIGIDINEIEIRKQLEKCFAMPMKL
jgi:G3E family GTPase